MKDQTEQFIPVPHDLRFRSLAEATKFFRTRDLSLCIQQFRKVQLENGSYKFEVNPEWEDAPYAEIIVKQYPEHCPPDPQSTNKHYSYG